jgi:hypothetical protein
VLYVIPAMPLVFAVATGALVYAAALLGMNAVTVSEVVALLRRPA